jgi:hypothetical protein
MFVFDARNRESNFVIVRMLGMEDEEFLDGN